MFDGSSCTIKQPARVKYAEERHGDTKLCFAGCMFHLEKSYERQNFLGSIRAQSGLVTVGGQVVGKLPGQSK